MYRQVKKYKMNDIVGLRFDFDQENINNYHMNVTIVKKSEEHVDFQVYLDVAVSVVLVLMAIRGIYLCCGPFTALVFVAYLVMYARNKIHVISEYEALQRQLQAEQAADEAQSVDSNRNRSAALGVSESEAEFQNLEPPDSNLVPPMLSVYAFGSWGIGASFEALLFSRFDVDDPATPMFFLRFLIVVVTLVGCVGVHFAKTRLSTWYKSYLAATSATPSTTPQRPTNATSASAEESEGTVETKEEPVTKPTAEIVGGNASNSPTSTKATGLRRRRNVAPIETDSDGTGVGNNTQTPKTKFMSGRKRRMSGARPTTEGKMAKEDLDQLRRKMRFPDVIMVQEQDFSRYLLTRQRIVEWGREHNDSKFGVFILPRWGEYFLHLLPSQHYNSTRLRRNLQWFMDFGLPALFILQIFGFVYQPFAGRSCDVLGKNISLLFNVFLNPCPFQIAVGLSTTLTHKFVFF